MYLCRSFDQLNHGQDYAEAKPAVHIGFLDYILFKAATWKEIKMLASKDEYLNEAARTIFRLSADEQIRKRCRDREEYYQDLRSYDRQTCCFTEHFPNLTIH